MLIGLILCLSIILRLINIGQSLWLDEAAQVIESSRPLSKQLDIAGDFHPPFFHLLLHFWMKMGTSEIFMRLLTVLISVLSIYLLYKISRKLVDRDFALLTSFFLAINPFAVYYSQELRPYPLTIFVSLIAVWGVVNQSQFFLILGLTLFLYTTYFTPFFILGLAVYFYLWQRRKFRWFMKNTIISFIFFIPWLPSFLKQLQIGRSLTYSLPGWGEAVSLPVIKAIPLVFAKFFLGRMTIDDKLIYALLILLLIIIFLILTFKAYVNKHFYFFASLFFLPLISVLVVSVFLPIIEPKRLLFILPFFIMIMILGLKQLTLIKQRIVGVILVMISFYGLFSYFTYPRFQREHWREAVSFVENNGDGTQIVLFSFPEPFAPYLWYQKDKIDAYGVTSNFVINDSDILRLRNIVSSRKRVYLFQYLSALTDPENKIGKMLEEEGFVRIDTFDFSGVGFVYHYEKISLALAS